MREIVELAPRKLLGKEGRHSSELTELRERGRVAERVGEPERRRVFAKSRFEVALSVEELSSKGFAGWHVGVEFDP